MQVKAQLGDLELTALIDSDSTHNFLSTDAVRLLTLPLELHAGLSIAIANCERVPCLGFSAHTGLTIAKEAFTVDFYIIPLGGYDIILGTQWLVILGPILWDFGKLTMTFWRGSTGLLGVASRDRRDLRIPMLVLLICSPLSLPPSTMSLLILAACRLFGAVITAFTYVLAQTLSWYGCTAIWRYRRTSWNDSVPLCSHLVSSGVVRQCSPVPYSW